MYETTMSHYSNDCTTNKALKYCDYTYISTTTKKIRDNNITTAEYLTDVYLFI